MNLIVTLIGRTNVGKSTLFNKLTNTKNALVLNKPELTRDRKYSSFKIKNKNIILIDTAGINIKEDSLGKKIFQQTIISIKEAHIIFFLVSARDGLMHDDITTAKLLRKFNKKIILLINKIDGLNNKNYNNEFFSLGFKINFCISATNGIGIQRKIKNFLESYQPNNNINFKIQDYNNIIPSIEKKTYLNNENKFIKIAIIGKPNVGKSTLINSLLNTQRMIVDNQPGTTRDSIWNIITFKGNKNYAFVDTAGLRKKNKTKNEIEKLSINKTLKIIKIVNIVILMIDSTNDISDQDLIIFNYVVSYGCSIIIIFNKCDQISTKIRKNIICSKKLKLMCYSHVHFISAKFNKGINHMFKLIDKTFINSNKKINTNKLIKILNIATKNHQPPIVQGNRIKIKYAHIGKYNPITIILHGNKLNFLPYSYKKYLENFFYKTLDIKSIPIHIQFKTNKNPYV